MVSNSGTSCIKLCTKHIHVYKIGNIITFFTFFFIGMYLWICSLIIFLIIVKDELSAPVS